MKGTRWMLLAVLLAWALCANALAAGNGETTYRALLIGVDGYQTNALSGCVNDTGRMSQALQAANEAGAFYQAPVIRSNLQTDEILQLSSELETWNVDEDDVTFFYYARPRLPERQGHPGHRGQGQQDAVHRRPHRSAGQRARGKDGGAGLPLRRFPAGYRWGGAGREPGRAAGPFRV